MHPPRHDESLINEDIAPVPLSKRTWSAHDVAALWIGMAVCIPTYTIASSLLGSGLTWWQAVLTVFLGNLIVLVPMTLNAHPGTDYGIPFPVLLRASFGIRGANITALLRGVVACGWFGIQTWIGGAAIYSTLGMIFGFAPPEAVGWFGISAGQFACFMAFWAVNVYFILKGMESIKWLEVLSAPFLLLVGVALMVWALGRAGGLSVVLAGSSKALPVSEFLPVFGAGLTAMVGFWATLSLNIPDFSRYAKSQKDQVLGQAIGLPPTMTLYSFAGIMIADYHVLRSRKLDVDELYRVHGIYRFTRGFSLAGLGAFLLAVLPNLPGFLVQVGAVDASSVPDFLEMLYRQAWFVGFALGFVLYLVFRKIAPVKIQP